MANKTQISWQAPVENTDGTPIDYPLDYELAIRSEGAADYNPVSVFPGTLNPDGSYNAQLADFAVFDSLGTFNVAMRAINRDKPSAVSDWSNEITFVLSAEIPMAPFGLAAI